MKLLKDGINIKWFAILLIGIVSIGTVVASQVEIKDNLPSLFPSGINTTNINIIDGSGSIISSTIYNIYLGAVKIGAIVDGYGCEASYCIYQPWYAPGQIYAKDGGNGTVSYSGNNASIVISNAANLKDRQTIFIMDGTLAIPSQITITKNISILFSSQAVWDASALSGESVLNISATKTVDILNPTIENSRVFTIYYNGSNGKVVNGKFKNLSAPTANAAGVLGRECEVSVIDSTFTNITSVGISMQGCKDGTIDGNIVSMDNWNKLAIDVSGDEALFVNTVNEHRTKNYTISNNKVFKGLRGISIESADNNRVFGNFVWNSTWGILLLSTGNVNGYGATGNNIYGNIVESARDGIELSNSDKPFNSMPQRNTICNNIINNSFRNGIFIYSTNNTKLCNNVITNSDVSLSSASLQSAGIKITSNASWNSSNTTISNNDIYDDEEKSTTTHGIRIRPNVNGYIYIFDNFIRAKTASIQDDSSGKPEIVRRNNYNDAGYDWGVVAMTASNRVLAHNSNDRVINSSRPVPPNMCQSTAAGDNWVFANNGTSGC